MVLTILRYLPKPRRDSNYFFNATVSFILQLQCILQIDICYSGLIKQISNTSIWYNSGMSRIPPIPPQSGIAVYSILLEGLLLIGKQ